MRPIKYSFSEICQKQRVVLMPKMQTITERRTLSYETVACSDAREFHSE